MQEIKYNKISSPHIGAKDYKVQTFYGLSRTWLEEFVGPLSLENVVITHFTDTLIELSIAKDWSSFQQYIPIWKGHL